MKNELLSTVLKELKSKKSKSCGCEDMQESIQSAAKSIKTQTNRFQHPGANMRNKCGKFTEGSELHQQCIYDVMNQGLQEVYKAAIHETVSKRIITGQEDVSEDVKVAELIRGVKDLHGLIASYKSIDDKKKAKEEDEEENGDMNEQMAPPKSGKNIGISQRGKTKGKRIADVAAPLPGTPEYDNNPEVYKAMQSALNVAGAGSGIGIPADLFATGHSLYHGKYGDAVVNLAGVLPVAGEAKAIGSAALGAGLLAKFKKAKPKSGTLQATPKPTKSPLPKAVTTVASKTKNVATKVAGSIKDKLDIPKNYLGIGRDRRTHAQRGHDFFDNLAKRQQEKALRQSDPNRYLAKSFKEKGVAKTLGPMALRGTAKGLRRLLVGPSLKEKGVTGIAKGVGLRAGLVTTGLLLKSYGSEAEKIKADPTHTPDVVPGGLDLKANKIPFVDSIAKAAKNVAEVEIQRAKSPEQRYDTGVRRALEKALGYPPSERQMEEIRKNPNYKAIPSSQQNESLSNTLIDITEQSNYDWVGDAASGLEGPDDSQRQAMSKFFSDLYSPEVRDYLKSLENPSFESDIKFKGPLAGLSTMMKGDSKSMKKGARELVSAAARSGDVGKAIQQYKKKLKTQIANYKTPDYVTIGSNNSKVMNPSRFNKPGRRN